MTEQPPPPRGSAAEFDDRRNVRLYDLTQPLIVNKTPICQTVAELLRQRPRTLRIAELGCGTGLFSLPVLAALDSFDYLGLDASGAMIQVLREKLERQPTRGSTSFLSGCDLRRRDAYEAVWQFQPDVVISAQFLQYIPIQPPSEPSAAQLSRLGFLQLCRSKLPADGLLVLFEDVAGETQQETCELGAAWDARVIQQYREHPELLKRVAELDADFVRAVKRAMDNPQIMALVRERRRSARGEKILPLSTYKDMFQQAGFAATIWQHPELVNFYLFVLEPAHTSISSSSSSFILQSAIS